MDRNLNQKHGNGWNGTAYILFPALLFTVAYELISAVLSALLPWILANGSSAWKAAVLNHPGDISAVCSALSAAAGFLTVWKTARSEIAYTKPLDFSFAFPASAGGASAPETAGNGPSAAGDGSYDMEKDLQQDGKGKCSSRESVRRGVWRMLLSGGERPADAAVAAAVGGILLSLFLNAALTTAGASQADAGTAAASRQTAAVSLLPGILVYGILTPFCEESVFRGITFPRTCRAFLPSGPGRGAAAGALISSVLFGLYHGNLVQGFYAFCMGIVFCLFYLLCGNLLLVTALHGAVNIVTLVSSQTGFYSILVSSPAWMAAVAAGAVLCGGYVRFRLEKRTGRL